MAHFFLRRVQQSNDATTMLRQIQSPIGSSLGLMTAVFRDIPFEPMLSDLKSELLEVNTSLHPWADLRVWIALAWSRVSRAVTQAGAASEDKKMALLAVDLFCRWKQTVAVGIQELIDLYELEYPLLPAAEVTRIIQEITALYPRCVVADPNDANFMFTVPDICRSMLDLGYSAHMWTPVTARDHIVRSVTLGAIRVPAADMQDAANALVLSAANGPYHGVTNPHVAPPVQHAVSMQAGQSMLYFAHVAHRNKDQYMGRYMKAAMSCIAALCRPGGNLSDNWIETRSNRIAEEMGLTLADVEISQQVTSLFRQMSQVNSLTEETLFEALYSIARVGRVTNLPPLMWMVNQAAFSGLTAAATMARHIAVGHRVLLSLWLDVLSEGEIKDWIRAVSHACEFPYGTLVKVPFPATLYPNIAAGAIGISQKQGEQTFTNYAGNFAGKNAAVVNNLITGYISLNKMSCPPTGTLAELLKPLFAQSMVAQSSFTPSTFSLTLTQPFDPTTVPAGVPAQIRNLLNSCVFDQASGEYTIQGPTQALIDAFLAAEDVKWNRLRSGMVAAHSVMSSFQLDVSAVINDRATVQAARRLHLPQEIIDMKAAWGV